MDKGLVDNEENFQKDNLIDFDDFARKHSSAYLNHNPNEFKIPKSLKKTFFITTSLFVVGLILLILGIVVFILYEEGSGFIILACIILIPGVYYTIQFCRARSAKDFNKTHDILENSLNFSEIQM